MSCFCYPLTKQYSWKDLLPYVKPWAPMAPDAFVLQQIRLAAIEFCQRTLKVTRRIRVDGQANVADYPIEIPDSWRIAAVHSVYVSELYIYRPRIMKFPDKSVTGRTFFLEPSDLLHVHCAPTEDEAGMFEVLYSVTPSQDSCILDPVLYEEHAEDLAWGALARLLMVPDKSWTDQAAAQSYKQQFKVAVDRAKIRKNLNETTGPMTFAPQRWI